MHSNLSFMKKSILLFAISMGAIASTAQPAQMALLGNWHDDNLILTSWLNSRYNDVWGFVINGQEYAAIGSTEAIHIISLADPTQPEEIARVYGTATGSNLVHRDIKEFNGYLYCVADEGASSMLQIIDLHNLPSSVSVPYSSNEFIVTAHNLFIDTAAHRLYALGAQGQTKVMDISNPVKPVLLAAYPNPSFYLPYVHDAYINDNIGIMNCAGHGLWVVDFSDPLAPVTLGTLTDYPDQGYNHSGWISKDGNYYFMCDETHGMDIKVVDISNPSNLQVVATFSPGLWNGEIAHNVMIRGDLLYASYYYNGVQVWNVSNPSEPKYWGYYDTYPGPDQTFYAGNWGIYSQLPSNTILASDMQGGLFVLKGLPQPSELSVQPILSNVELCQDESLLLSITVGTGFSANVGVHLSASLADIPLDLPAMSVAPGDTLTVEITGLPETADTLAYLTFIASDGTFQAEGSVQIVVHPLPQIPQLLAPADGATDVNEQPNFEWTPAGTNVSYLVQIATDSNNFENNIIFSESTNITTLSISEKLNVGYTYYWRVVADNAGCKTESDIASFAVATVSSVVEFQPNLLEVYPVPATDLLVLNLTNLTNGPFAIKLLNTSGMQVMSLETMNNDLVELDVTGLPAGPYLLCVSGNRTMVVEKLLLFR